MFTDLMKLANDDRSGTEPRPQRSVGQKRSPSPSRVAAGTLGRQLPPVIEPTTAVDQQARNFRLTEAEHAWLQTFVLERTLEYGEKFTQALMIRLFIRLAHDQWRRDPEDNELRRLIDSLPPA